MAMLTVRNAMSRAEICPLSILFQFFRYRHLSALVNHIKYRIDGGALPLSSLLYRVLAIFVSTNRLGLAPHQLFVPIQ